MYGELSLPPVWSGRNRQTGRFLKGHVPANKGKKWSEFKSKRSQKRSSRGWKNLDLHRNKNGRAVNAGRSKKQVVGVFDDGRFLVFPYAGAAAMWLGASRENIGRCCRQNKSRKVCKNDWRKGEKKGASRVNTDHRYKGIRWYFEDDDAWTEKISPTKS